MKEILNDIEQQRFMEAVNRLKEERFIRSISALCRKFGKNKSYLSDIRTKNVTISADFVKRVFEEYPINEQYIFTGKGEMLHSEQEQQEQQQPKPQQPSQSINQKIDYVSQLIDTQNKYIHALEAEIKQLKEQIEQLEK